MPLNRYMPTGCAYDPSSGVGICGDWFSPRVGVRGREKAEVGPAGPGIESAYLSGRELAGVILQSRDQKLRLHGEGVKEKSGLGSGLGLELGLGLGLEEDGYFQAIPKHQPPLGALIDGDDEETMRALRGPRLGPSTAPTASTRNQNRDRGKRRSHKGRSTTRA